MFNFQEVNTNRELKHYSYPSIAQYRNVIANVKHHSHYVGQDDNGDAIYDNTRPLPKLKFVGSTKLHGTNAGIIFDLKNNVIYCQSRENVITPLKDNAGFANFVAQIQPQLEAFINSNNFEFDDVLAVFGEWCGGSIQRGVAISGLDKMFVIFDICKIDSEDGERNWISHEELKSLKDLPKGFYNMYSFPTWEIDIDFANPELSQQQLIDLTIQVEESCPIGKAFNVDGVGEGIVWKCTSKDHNNSGFWMKVKGEKHANSKVKTLAAVDVEKIQSLKQFAETYVTEARCEQSIQKLREAGKPLDRTSLGEYLKWIVNDIFKEELDTIVANKMEPKELGGPISNKAREWFFKNEINLV